MTAVPWHHHSLSADADDGTKTISAPATAATTAPPIPNGAQP
jgi:hypothetical protein